MKHVFTVIVCVFLLCNSTYAQEVQANVTINTQQIGQTNQQIFNTLQSSLQEFINNTHWTDKKINPNERIECNFIFTINSYESGNFNADLQIQASRPIYNSMYTSPLLNYKDVNAGFSYQEYEPLSFNSDRFSSNLTSLIAFYINIILGLDADSFSANGGYPYFVQAQKIVTLAQNSGYSGWTQDNSNNRWQLIEDLLSENHTEFHKTYYDYHRLGLDNMSEQPREAKQKIADALIGLKNIQQSRINSYLIQLFFDTKNNEILEIFSDGPTINTRDLKEALISIMPSNATQWEQIK